MGATPTDPERPPGKTFADMISNVKLVAGVASALVLMGFSASLYLSRLATKDDVQQSIAPVRETVNKIDEQTNAHETRIQIIERWQSLQIERDRIRDQQLFEIAVKVGAHIVPGIQPPPDKKE
jgi:hypothetical protein